MRKHTKLVGLVRICAANLDGYCGTARARLNGVGGGELDKICNANLFFVCEVSKIAT
jgi:hypothetical protein